MKQKWNAYLRNTIKPAFILTCLSCTLLLIASTSGVGPNFNSFGGVVSVFFVFLIPMTIEDGIVFLNGKWSKNKNR